ncbi:MAG: MoaD/ThiS family protein [Chloroflexota bacterium]|nr:MoaD/ThiS family protein [Chloroflexota bacterium]
MPADVTVFVPIGMRPLTGGRRVVSACGRTVAEVVADLETNYPGFHESLVEDGRLRRGLTIAVNSVEQPLGLLAKVPERAEVHILPAMAGGVV